MRHIGRANKRASFVENIVFIVIAVFFISIVLMGVKTVSQGYQYNIERFGKFRRSLTPGLHLIIPVIDKVGAKVNMMEQVLDIPEQQVISQDNATVTIDAVCFYQVIDAPKASYEVNDLTRAMQNLIMTNIRTVLGSMDLDEMLSKRDQINARILGIVDEATNPWGVKVTRIEIKDILPPRDLVDAMAQQMKAERIKRAQILEAQGEKQSAILRAEGDKEAEIRRAEGERQAAFLEAEARERQAEAEAKATNMVSEAISQGNLNAINYFIAQKYVDAMAKFANSPNEKLVFMPLEASSVISSIGGIAELAKQSFSKS